MTKLKNRCANCGGKFGLVYHHHWGLRFCRKACKDNFLAKTARMRRWLGWVADRPICGRSERAETGTKSSCDDARPSTSGRKVISHTSATMGMRPIPPQDNPGKKPAFKQAGRAHVPSASKVDYLIRRWVIPDHPCNVRSFS
jgi:hypothetical protein